MTDQGDDEGVQPADANPVGGIHDRLARLELFIEALVAELHRHISLRLPDPADLKNEPKEGDAQE